MAEIVENPMISDKEIKKKMKPKFHGEYTKFYPVIKLEELGFVRGICSVCGKGFWNMDSSRTTCDDTICTNGYRFIGQRITKKQFGYKEAWDKYVEIFSKWDYKPLDRYPVVARWYDDLYFTAAGINAFQPFITAGHQDPPYQRVLGPQMCLRFNDIDNVGITGTHYTAFIMVGQHVFNSEKLGESYWMSDGIEQIFTFLKDGITIPPKEITFHEDVWAGGGNFGPSMEFFAGGIELGNQVYIQYDSSSMEQLDTRVIDMGAGLERWSWFSSGHFTSYDSTFPDVMKYLYKSSGFKPDPEIWSNFMTYAGTLNVDEVTDVRQSWINVATKLDMSYQELRDSILPVRALYALGDHTRNLLFSIRDGALPSNVGGGYNLRNLLRRCYSLIDEFNFDLDFHKIFELHIKEIGSWFTDLQEIGSLYSVLDLEKDRYYETRKKNSKYINRLVKDNEEISVEELLKLYDSRGITPESILEVNNKVKIPENFYLKVNELHEKRQKRYTKSPLNSNVPPTKLLYYNETYSGEYPFNATILDIIDNKWVVLDQTHFYPEGGGQVGDIGTINNVTILDTQIENQRVYHQVEDVRKFKLGQKVSGQINWKRRYHLMKLHSGTHLVKWASSKVLGPHIWQAGARKLPDKATLDITHFKSLTYQEIKEIEKLVNYYINEEPINSNINIYERTEAERKFGMEIYQGGAIPHTHLRIIEWKDEQACSGTHLRNTSEIGFLKIIKSDRIQDGIVRLEYEIGETALKRVQTHEGVLRQLSDKWKVGINDIPTEADRITKDWLFLGKEINNLREKVVLFGLEKIFSLEKNEIWIHSQATPDSRILSPILTKFVQENAEKLTINSKTIFIVTKSMNDILAVSSNDGFNLEENLKSYCEIIKRMKIKSKNKNNYVQKLDFFQGFKILKAEIQKIEFDMIF